MPFHVVTPLVFNINHTYQYEMLIMYILEIMML